MEHNKSAELMRNSILLSSELTVQQKILALEKLDESVVLRRSNPYFFG
jgi:hypothetical protein